MKIEVSPQLLSEIQRTLPFARADKTALANLYERVFGVKLRTNCNFCIEDGIKHLQSLLNKPTKTMATATKYKWTSDKKYEKATVPARVAGKLTIISKENLTDTYAEVLASGGKYAHLVEPVNGEVTQPQTEENFTGEVGELEAQPKTMVSQTSEVITSTSTEHTSEGQTVKRRGRKPKS